jgi:hypothetical protein
MLQPRLLALKSAVPPYTIEQPDVAKRAAQLFSKVRDIERFMPVFVNTGIAALHRQRRGPSGKSGARAS